MTAIIAAIVSMLPGILLRLVLPFINEETLAKIAEKIIVVTLRKVAQLTKTDEDDKLVQFIADTWEKSKNTSAENANDGTTDNN